MTILDRIFGVLLILGGIGHALGSFKVYADNPMELLWALCATFFVFLLATINLVRASRVPDATLGWICTITGLIWIAASLRFGQLIDHILDPRPVIFVVITGALCLFSIRTILHPRRP